MSKKLRLDQVLVAKGLFPSREQAQRAVMAGEVKVGTRIAAKPSQLLGPDVAIAVKPTRKYIGRGALKLESALNYFKIDIHGKVALDIGASTGGFTDGLRVGNSRRCDPCAYQTSVRIGTRRCRARWNRLRSRVASKGSRQDR